MNRDELIRLAGQKLADSIFRPAPTDVADLEARPMGEITGGEVRFFLYHDVLDELAFAADYRPECSSAVLLGAFAVDEQGPFLEVTGFSHLRYLPSLDDLYDEVKPALDDLAAELSGRPDSDLVHIVGIFVGAAGSRGRLPVEVARTHLSLLNVPYQLAAVVDPDAGQIGLYARTPGGPFYNSPFWAVERLDGLDMDS